MPMVRKHGWQLPAHTLQIVAITVFFLLVVAFYAFFAPFLGSQVLEYVAVGIYTPVVFAVLILYVRCTSINPADPGIMSKFEDGFIDAPAGAADLEGASLPEKVDATGANSPASTCRSSLNGRSNHASLAAGDTNINLSSQPPQRSSKSCLLGGLVCALFIKGDCRKFDDSENQVDGEDAMFCTICNAEVRKFSKHCRNCDKCVDGFDHHCRWLNNCVGRKNYFTFIALMITSLLWLAIEFGTGIAVLVICFTKKNSETAIKGKLANGLTRPPFATIVAFFTLLSLVACVPLCELFFFHMLLIRKGITTYEYVVAMRAMSEVPEEEDEEEGVNIVYSRTNSATTAFSGASSLGVHHKGAWCTPPRIFVDQDEVVPHLEPGMVPSSVDPDAAAHAKASKARKPVKISAWKLAKLDSHEAMKAAARARASSSVLRPVDAARRGASYSDLGSSGNGSMRSSMSAATKGKGIDRKLSSLQSSSYPQSLASQDEDYDESGASSISSPVHVLNNNKPSVPRSSQITSVPPPQPPRPAPVVLQRPPVVPSTQQIAKPPFQSATSYVRENRKASVVWDQEAGRYVSVASTRPRRGVDAPQFFAIPGGGARASSSTAAAAAALPSGQASERLAYTGQSIFSGGPRLGAAADPGTGRRTAESFPVFAPGTLQKNPPFNFNR